MVVNAAGCQSDMGTFSPRRLLALSPGIVLSGSGAGPGVGFPVAVLMPGGAVLEVSRGSSVLFAGAEPPVGTTCKIY